MIHDAVQQEERSRYTSMKTDVLQPTQSPQAAPGQAPSQKTADLFDNIPDLLRTKYEEDQLYVEFPAGNIVMYKDVPEEKYLALCEAPKKSRYLFEHIMGEHEAEQVKGIL